MSSVSKCRCVLHVRATASVIICTLSLIKSCPDSGYDKHGQEKKGKIRNDYVNSKSNIAKIDTWSKREKK